MKTIFIITALLLAAIPLNADDPLAERKAEILELIAAIPENLRCGTGIPWYGFQSRQHDDLTLDALVNLAKTTQEDKVRDLAVASLTYQKNARLIPYWRDFIVNLENVGVRSYKHVQAVKGLLRINSPQSTQLLMRMLSGPDTPEDTIALICSGCSTMKSMVPREIWSQIEALSSHESGRVRTVAFLALLSEVEDAFPTQDARKKHLDRALAHHDRGVVCRALRSLGYAPVPEFLPRMFDFLYYADVAIRVEADLALRNLLLHDSGNEADMFNKCENALRKKRWIYRAAPLLAARYAQILQDARGEFVEAEHALQTAYRTYASNDSYRERSPDWGAIMLRELIEVKLKRGDHNGAIEVLRRLVKDYPNNTRAIAPNLPRNLRRRFQSAARADATLQTVLEVAPVHVRVKPLVKKYYATQRPRFKVSTHNISDEDVILHCAERTGGGVLVSNNAAIEINTDNWTTFHQSVNWTTFHESLFLADTVKHVTVPPGESFSFVGTLAPFDAGHHVIDFWFDITCEFESGEKWSHRVLANSVKLTIPRNRHRKLDNLSSVR